MSERDEICAINFIPVRAGVDPKQFVRFSAEVDQPICLAQEVVLGFDAYAVAHADAGAPQADIVEVMRVRSWEEWVRVRDQSGALRPVIDGFTPLVDPDAVRTVFAKRISPNR